MVWITRKVMRVERDGKIIRLDPGDPIPEVETWDKEAQAYWSRRGFVQSIPRPTPKEPVTIKVDNRHKTRKIEMTLTDYPKDEKPSTGKKSKKTKRPEPDGEGS